MVITSKMKCAYHVTAIAMGLQMNLMENVIILLTSVTVKMVLKGRNVSFWKKTMLLRVQISEFSSRLS